MSDPGPRSTTIWMTEEDQELAKILMEQTGLSMSALIRGLIHKAALGKEGLNTEEIREHIAALAKLLL